MLKIQEVFNLNYFGFLNKGTLEHASPNIKDWTTGSNLFVIETYAEVGICDSLQPLINTFLLVKFEVSSA